jgi:hypothetical protein
MGTPKYSVVQPSSSKRDSKSYASLLLHHTKYILKLSFLIPYTRRSSSNSFANTPLQSPAHSINVSQNRYNQSTPVGRTPPPRIETPDYLALGAKASQRPTVSSALPPAHNPPLPKQSAHGPLQQQPRTPKAPKQPNVDLQQYAYQQSSNQRLNESTLTPRRNEFSSSFASFRSFGTSPSKMSARGVENPSIQMQPTQAGISVRTPQHLSAPISSSQHIPDHCYPHQFSDNHQSRQHQQSQLQQNQHQHQHQRYQYLAAPRAPSPAAIFEHTGYVSMTQVQSMIDNAVIQLGFTPKQTMRPSQVCAARMDFLRLKFIFPD